MNAPFQLMKQRYELMD